VGGLEEMKYTAVVACVLFVACSAGWSDDSKKEVPIAELREFYKAEYPFFEMADTLYLPQTELQLPDGFGWPDSSRLTPMQNWMNHFPIWHQYKSVGKWNGEKAKTYDQITRCIHLPWSGPAYKDFAFPWRVAMEYLRHCQAESLFQFIPVAGPTVTYPEYLKHTLAFGPRSEIKLIPDTQRTGSVEELYKCFGYAITNMNYKFLIANCDSLDAKRVGPGDLFLAADSIGKDGAAYVIMFVIENKKKERLFAVGTGGKVASDFHIPLVHNDRHRPWMTLDDIKALTPPNSAQSGFYRFSFFRNLKEVTGK
jgi:hypothetical protein